ncbi:MAG: prepilin-type N-terminal cleavage/methylation domain-containing protein [Candidatus Eisenbacteria bacterium]|nr:prepilin-type N-terminal cleavage/methylation domain-containing protein [Candidatus Eisenbacteria bacterium]
MNERLRSRRPAGLRNPRAGFTLIEVMVALVIFAVGVLSLGLVVPAATKRVTKAGVQTRASALAAERAETLLTTPYGHDDLLSGAHTDPENPVDSTYYVRWTVTDDAPIAGCKRVVVSVSKNSVGAKAEAAVTIVCPQSGG